MTALSSEQQAMVALFQRHVEAELAGDLDTTMATMSDDPHLNHVPNTAGASAARACGHSIGIISSVSSSLRM
jgi:carboxymethylenebutenolidase